MEAGETFVFLSIALIVMAGWLLNTWIRARRFCPLENGAGAKIEALRGDPGDRREQVQ